MSIIHPVLPPPAVWPTDGGLGTVSYHRTGAAFQGESLQEVHTFQVGTTSARKTRHLAQPVTSFVTIGTNDEHRSFAIHQPPRALIELARRCGLLAAAEAHDAGLSVPAIAVRP